MASLLPSLPYPLINESSGYWIPITSTIDWCEENYYVTIYSAELINSLTNLTFVLLAFVGMHNCYIHSHDRVFFITYLGYLLTGLGSFAFHSTLKYPMQLVDELSMIYSTCLMLWATLSHERGAAVRWGLGVGIAGIAAFITGYYHYLQDPKFHQDAYAVLTAIVLIRSMAIMEMTLRPRFRKEREGREGGGKGGKGKVVGKEEAERRDIRDREILRRMWWLIGFGLSVFLGGFGIWTLDNEQCSRLRGWRREIGLPWGILLEGHGWWHLMTGFGAYCYIVWGIWLRHCLNGKQDEYELIWPGMFTSLPRIVRVTGKGKKTQ